MNGHKNGGGAVVRERERDVKKQNTQTTKYKHTHRILRICCAYFECESEMLIEFIYFHSFEFHNFLKCFSLYS